MARWICLKKKRRKKQRFVLFNRNTFNGLCRSKWPVKTLNDLKHKLLIVWAYTDRDRKAMIERESMQ